MMVYCQTANDGIYWPKICKAWERLRVLRYNSTKIITIHIFSWIEPTAFVFSHALELWLLLEGSFYSRVASIQGQLLLKPTAIEPTAFVCKVPCLAYFIWGQLLFCSNIVPLQLLFECSAWFTQDRLKITCRIQIMAVSNRFCRLHKENERCQVVPFSKYILLQPDSKLPFSLRVFIGLV